MFICPNDFLILAFMNVLEFPLKHKKCKIYGYVGEILHH